MGEWNIKYNYNTNKNDTVFKSTLQYLLGAGGQGSWIISEWRKELKEVKNENAPFKFCLLHFCQLYDSCCGSSSGCTYNTPNMLPILVLITTLVLDGWQMVWGLAIRGLLVLGHLWPRSALRRSHDILEWYSFILQVWSHSSHILKFSLNGKKLCA